MDNNIYDSLFSPASNLRGQQINEQIARQVFDILPDNGPIVVIMDVDRNCWPSDSEKFSDLNISESFLTDLCSKIEDGAEPVITQINDYSIIASQLIT